MITTILLFLAGGNVQGGVDILAQSRSGKVLCANPDGAAKSCSSITSFNLISDGSIIETTEVLLTPDPVLTLTMSIGTKVSGDSACGVMTLDDLRRGQVRLNGKAIPSDRNALVLKRLEASMAALAGKQVCDAIRYENNGLVKYGQIDGVDIKLPGKPII